MEPLRRIYLVHLVRTVDRQRPPPLGSCVDQTSRMSLLVLLPPAAFRIAPIEPQ